MFNSLWSRPKKLALNSKSRIISRISEKRTTWWGIHNFLEISVTFDFHPGISRTFSWTVRFSEFQRSNGKRPRTTLWGDPNFRKFLTRNYRYKVEFPPQGNFGLNGSLCGFRFSSGFFGKRSQEISLPFVPISKFSEFEVGWKTLLVLEIPNTKARQV